MSLTPSLAVFRHRAYAHFWVMRVAAGVATQMLSTAIGLQVYDLARLTMPVEQAAFLLGFIGLAQFLPLLMFSLLGGVVADRFDRKLILVVALVVRMTVVLSLLGVALLIASGMPPLSALPAIFAAAAVLGLLNAFFPAASQALLPRIVPRGELPQAIAWNSLGFQGAAISGPAFGGLLYVGGPETVYAVSAALYVLAGVLIASARTPKHVPLGNVRTVAMVKEGLAYVWGNKVVFGAISLDLVVVLFGGATALLPVFARDILHVGPTGFGLLRAAPAAGAAVVALILATTAIRSHVGKWMLASVAVYGAAMLVFGVSTLFWLSLLALAITGAADMISVYVRQSLIPLATPDAMRGRVSSVSFIFISGSNELGEFESGVAARFLGPVGAVILGGVVAMGAAVAWFRLFPQLTHTNTFEDAVHEDNRAEETADVAAAADTRTASKPL